MASGRITRSGGPFYLRFTFINKQKLNRALAAAALLALPAGALYAGGGHDDAKTFRQSALDLHNRARAEVGVAPLRWSSELEAAALSQAERLARAHRLYHDKGAGSGMGENLWAGTSGAYRVDDMLGLMLGEARYYRPGRFPNVSRTGRWNDVGHYTQMIWPTTQRVGCAVATDGTEEYMVCRYTPSGNVVGTDLR